VQVRVGYPDDEAEQQILRQPRHGLDTVAAADVRAIVSARDLATAQRETDETLVSDEVIQYTTAVVRRTRDLPSVSLGASPRAGVHLLAAARGAARIVGRSFVTPDDIVRMAPAVLAHRLVLRPEAELERYTPSEAVAAALASVPVPR
jgi:MoxR-like ATPase